VKFDECAYLGLLSRADGHQPADHVLKSALRDQCFAISASKDTNPELRELLRGE
jgi:hypothetical protein